MAGVPFCWPVKYRSIDAEIDIDSQKHLDVNLGEHKDMSIHWNCLKFPLTHLSLWTVCSVSAIVPFAYTYMYTTCEIANCCNGVSEWGQRPSSGHCHIISAWHQEHVFCQVLHYKATYLPVGVYRLVIATLCVGHALLCDAVRQLNRPHMAWQKMGGLTD